MRCLGLSGQKRKSSDVEEAKSPTSEVDSEEIPKVKMVLKVKEIVHGECNVNGQVKKFAFLPSAEGTSKLEIQRLLAIWKIKPPNLVMQLNGHNTKSSCLVSDEMLNDIPEFKEFKSKLNNPDLSLEDANEIVENQAESIISAVGIALDMSDSLILHNGMPFTNQYILGRALHRSKATPTIIAVDDFGDYNSRYYSGCAEIKQWAQELLQCAVPLKEKASNRQPAIMIGNEYVAKQWINFLDNPELPPNHEDIFTTAEIQVLKTKLQTHAPWSSATHYIFAHDSKRFNPNLLGNAGLLALGGGWGLHGTELRAALDRGDPDRKSVV